jgi:hypothetical protein
MFSLSASPLGCLIGGASAKKLSPHGGRANKAAWRENPVFMRLRRTLPMVTMRLEQGQSQWENAAFPQFSSVFMGEMPIFA